jgi:hypothetical protein
MSECVRGPSEAASSINWRTFALRHRRFLGETGSGDEEVRTAGRTEERRADSSVRFEPLDFVAGLAA